MDRKNSSFTRFYQIKIWHGGKVHKIRPSVLHLMRGQVFEICNRSIFTFGGASSHDISGGILEMDTSNFHREIKRLNRVGIPYRINHWSWWAQELPSKEEMEEGRKNLEEHNNTVDFIVTHCCASSTQQLLGREGFEDDIETRYLEEILQSTNFKKWFFGHYHDNQNVTEKEILLYEQVIRIA